MAGVAHRRKLIEVALPVAAINAAGAREKGGKRGHPSSLHLWWSRKPLSVCRAVLFAQLVDDPSAWPDVFSEEGAVEQERRRLFRVIEALVEPGAARLSALAAARREVCLSIARAAVADGRGDAVDEAILSGSVSAEEAAAYLVDRAPEVLDPFVGGGSVALAGQRLGLRVAAGDINPVPHLITTAQVDAPARFAGRASVGRPPARRPTSGTGSGLALDVEHYGRWMLAEAEQRIGRHYPSVRIDSGTSAATPWLRGYEGRRLTVRAWLWARTIVSPHPKALGARVPLMFTFWLSKKKGHEVWLEPMVDIARRTWRFEIRHGKPLDARRVDDGTRGGRGIFRCLLTGELIAPEYVCVEASAGRMSSELVAIVAEGDGERVYLAGDAVHRDTASVTSPGEVLTTTLPDQALGLRVQRYGMRRHRDLFSPRQLIALTTFSDLVGEVWTRVRSDAVALGMAADEVSFERGGEGADAYADAVCLYLALAIDRFADYWTVLATWEPSGGSMSHTFTRQGLGMVWCFAEANPFSGRGGSAKNLFEWTIQSVGALPRGPRARCFLADAGSGLGEALGPDRGWALISSDPPYYDNVPYGDLSDFFYVWLRRSLGARFSLALATMLVPKQGELIADPFRHGGRQEAEDFFINHLERALRALLSLQHEDFPAVIYYAFKQTERAGGAGATGWEAFLTAVIRAGYVIVGTWPLSTEQANRMRARGSNVTASSIALVCRRQQTTATAATRGDLLAELRREMPGALASIQHGNIAPVDLAQAAIGPGMAMFSRHAEVLEADGRPMSVKTALQLVNQALDEYFTEQEGEFDSDTRFGVTWFDTYGFDAGPFGEAETLAKARNVSVEGVVQSGILRSVAGKVRLLTRPELADGWEPAGDPRPTAWQATQHMIKRLEDEGEASAADLLGRLGRLAGPARDLAYRLYTTCERRGWAEEGRSYNGLVIAWPEIERLAEGGKRAGATRSRQEDLFS